MNLQIADDFLRFSTGIHAVGSKAPASYVVAIEKTQAALQRHHVFLVPGESIWQRVRMERFRVPRSMLEMNFLSTPHCSLSSR